jgi:hypothetical protein
MTNPGILTWMLALTGVRSASAHHEIMETIELFRALGTSYRLACAEVGSTWLHLRLTLSFLKTITAGAFPW